MTAPDKRRPLPALVVIAALTLLTALVWFRVLHRSDAAAHPAAANTPCPTPSATAPPRALPKPSAVTLVVLNSTSRSGLAAGAKKTLVADGFKVSQVANDATTYGGHGEITGVAEIRFGPSERAAAALLGYYVPGAKAVQTDSSAATVILSLGAKYTAILAPAKASAAISSATAHSTIAAPSPTPTATATASCSSS
ncbi:LytR C-terminal domain-containing protein [Jatrophihabitans sp.]|uniref:LytR C-terminal domain-containing protein n=1 Tax=Jatrophihabitans sp. TaxID=1932789 RepID=UPI0030C76102|nr:uncharacterized protein [Jatrophihabitans sp.]